MFCLRRQDAATSSSVGVATLRAYAAARCARLEQAMFYASCYMPEDDMLPLYFLSFPSFISLLSMLSPLMLMVAYFRIR